MLRKMHCLVLAVCLVLPGPAAAQSQSALLDTYGRVIGLLDFMTSYVGEILLACADKNSPAAAQTEERFKAYRQRNAVLLERADAWRQAAEKRLLAQGEGGAARERAESAGISATYVAVGRVKQEIDRASDARALCRARLQGIESGRYDLSVNADFVGLLKENP